MTMNDHLVLDSTCSGIVDKMELCNLKFVENE